MQITPNRRPFARILDRAFDLALIAGLMASCAAYVVVTLAQVV